VFNNTGVEADESMVNTILLLMRPGYLGIRGRIYVIYKLSGRLAARAGTGRYL